MTDLLEQAIAKLKNLSASQQDAMAMKCPKCASTHIRKNGWQRGKRALHMCEL